MDGHWRIDRQSNDDQLFGMVAGREWSVQPRAESGREVIVASRPFIGHGSVSPTAGVNHMGIVHKQSVR
jgi:hypothetical protein